MNDQMKAGIKSYAKVFAAVVLGLFLADGADIFAVDATDLRTWLAAGLASTLPILITALDPTDHRFGRGAGGVTDGAVE